MNTTEEFGFLTGQNINFIPLSVAHVDLYFKWNNDSRIRKYLGNSIPISIEKIKKSVINPESNYIGFEIWHKEDRKPIGYIHVNGINWMRRKASLGALIGEVEYWGKGLATEATKMIVKYCFEELNMNKVASLIYEPNRGSQKCVERAGFTLEATIGDAGYFEGKYCADLLYSYYRKDWDAKHQE